MDKDFTAPALPEPPMEGYDGRFFMRLLAVLRLFFKRLDTYVGLLAVRGRLPSLAHTSVATRTAIGYVYRATGNVTIDADVFSADDIFYIYNDTGASISIIAGAGVTLRLQGTATTGTRTLAQRSMSRIWTVSSTELVLDGVT